MLVFTRKGKKGFVVLSYREMEEIVMMASHIKIVCEPIKVLSNALYRITSEKDFKAREHANERIRVYLEDIKESIKYFEKKYVRALYRSRN